MAFKTKQIGIVIDSLIADLVGNVIEQSLSAKSESKAGPCQRLFDALGLMPCTLEEEDGDEDEDEEEGANAEIIRQLTDKVIDDAMFSAATPRNPPSADDQRQLWHSWLGPALTADRPEDEFDIYAKTVPLLGKFRSTACQTEQPRLTRKRNHCVVTPGDRALSDLAPCELSRQTVFIDALTVPTPNLPHRPPLGDRFCYMLTDFASALYCSLAIMCCCTPSMFR
ncbi:GH25003 [Drosophila grimshawi]|uniref:GH25003 n=1 Tax=Drosophila grimshawi TaxID=7222 RepID=B4K323_DROGR|nr:GH25003 [Drosophila grimshawi]